jgi:hypothetical protein
MDSYGLNSHIMAKSFAFNFGSIEYTYSSMGLPASSRSQVGSLTTTHGARNWMVLCLIAKRVAAAFGSGGALSSKPSTRTTVTTGAVPE